MRAWLCAVLLMLVTSVWRAGADWPQFRHDAAHTGVAESAAKPPLELRWQLEDDPHGDRGRFGPYRGLVFEAALATDSGVFVNRSRSGLMRLHPETGQVLWRLPAANLPVGLDGGTLVHVVGYALGQGVRDRPEVRACDAETGAALWSCTARSVADPKLRLADFNPFGAGGGWGVSLHEGLLCLTVEVYETGSGGPTPWAYFVDIEDGFVTNRLPAYPKERLPLVVGGPETIWGWGRQCAQAWGSDLILLGGLGHRGDPVPGLWALRADAQDVRTPLDAVANEWGKYGIAVLSTTYRMAYCLEALEGALALSGRDAQTGSLLWAQPLLDRPNTYCPPAADRIGVYLGLANGMVYALEPMTGRLRWERQVGNPLPREPEPTLPTTPLAPTCSVAGDLVWTVYQRKLLALNSATGEVAWETDKTRAEWCEPVISGGWVYLVTSYGIEAWGPPTEHAEPTETGPKAPQ